MGKGQSCPRRAFCHGAVWRRVDGIVFGKASCDLVLLPPFTSALGEEKR